MMFSCKLILFDHDRAYGGITNRRGNWGSQAQLNASAWLHHVQYGFNADRKRAEMRFKRDYMDKHTNTLPLLPAPRGEAVKPVQLVLLPVGEYVSGYHPKRIAS